ncbi:MAG: NAD(P)/FAD-dependent oxidoreductase [Fimbriimonas sp.]|nr:NAD(P)/FAD-dependent oxidoreductase [Fimbriimonas sp.]
MNCDVAIVGGGPSGATVAALLKLLQPHLDIVVLESSKFPRDHVGESLLPTSCDIFAEMGCWDKIEQEKFPIKLGAFYRWGQTPDLVRFTFLQDKFENCKRPGKFAGQRQFTTWQVDRGVFDKVLLDHAASLGCRVFEDSPVTAVHKKADSVTGLEVRSAAIPDNVVEARYYVDASGSRGMIRREFDVEVEYPTSLRNIAIWDYWQDAAWIDREGEGTYIRILSLDWGWLWFITIGETRTSVGLVTPAEYYKKSGMTTEELYARAIREEPNIGPLLATATREHQLQADKDWNYLSSRLVGENWFLAGDSCGFADPILSAGITLAVSGARKVAYSIRELEAKELDSDWVRSEYNRTHRANIKSHIRFADYWYQANKKFTELEDYCAEIAKDSGLSLEPKAAFQWLATGGFTDDYSDQPTLGTYQLSAVKSIIGQFTGERPEWQILRFNRLRLDLENAPRVRTATYRDGRIRVKDSYVRGDAALVIDAFYRHAIMALGAESETLKVLDAMRRWIVARLPDHNDQQARLITLEVLEAMYAQGWILGS